MLLRFLRKLLAIESPSGDDRACQRTASEQELEAFEQLLINLTERVPNHLYDTFQDSIQSFLERPTTGPELLDAIDRMHMGLGVAVGRGATGEDQKYKQLGQLVSWLYEELGRPQNTQFAVVTRAAAELKVREQKRSEA